MNSLQKAACPTWHGRERAGYTPQEVMRLTGSSRSFIYQAIAQGRLQAVRVGSRKLIIPAEALDKFLSL
ncbi:MAG: excisionase family DNA-binding protein [Acidobacteriota bacterium]